MSFTLLDADRAIDVTARIDGDRVTIPAAEVERALGWALTPDGLCGHNVCIPVTDPSALSGPHGMDLAALARLLDRPLAVDTTAGAAYLGAPAGDRRRILRSLRAPDFTLPDLSGRMHSLGDYRGKKVLLVAHASW